MDITDRMDRLHTDVTAGLCAKIRRDTLMEVRNYIEPRGCSPDVTVEVMNDLWNWLDKEINK